MGHIDSIIIGSGAGGLAAALALAKNGQKVVVIEQHYVPGGWCHSFYLGGQRFSPGVHYIGNMEKGASSSLIFESLGIANDLVFFRMKKDAYEHCQIGEKRFDLPAGIDNLYEKLAQQFPHEKKGLKKYLELVKKVSTQLYLIPKMSGFWDNLTIPFRTAQLGKYGLFSLRRVINWHIKDPLLQQILNVQCGDHGLPPALASFPVHCATMDHYFDGGFYPMGGGAGIVKALTNAIKKHNGEIRTGVGVEKILIETTGKIKKAVGVLLENGEKLFADNIVSNADPHQTYHKMIGKEHLSKSLQSKLNKTKYSVTSLMMFVTVDLDVTKAGIDSGNIWMMREKDMDRLYDDMSAEDILSDEEFPGLFINCSSMKDPAGFNGRHHTFELITYIKYESVAAFINERKERSEKYLQFKERVAEKFLNSLERLLPGVRNCIVQKNVATPITNEYYIRSTKGNVYGTEKTLVQVGPFSYSPKSEIRNLFLCGASTLSHGVSGALNSGLHTVAKILDKHVDELMVPEEGQDVRIYDAEDRTQWPQWLIDKVELRKTQFNKRAGLAVS
ncbi:MAG: NAD(P)/FAD-dependent oxidoreductase [Bacteroidetes bacterium]|nr:NAD(P)/FAD-dependent oxidoreductase [Bacteroidota bacterium]